MLLHWLPFMLLIGVLAVLIWLAIKSIMSDRPPVDYDDMQW